MLIVHQLGRSQSERMVWLCEDLGLVYTLQRHERDPMTMLAARAAGFAPAWRGADHGR